MWIPCKSRKIILERFWNYIAFRYYKLLNQRGCCFLFFSARRNFYKFLIWLGVSVRPFQFFLRTNNSRLALQNRFVKICTCQYLPADALNACTWSSKESASPFRKGSLTPRIAPFSCKAQKPSRFQFLPNNIAIRSGVIFIWSIN